MTSGINSNKFAVFKSKCDDLYAFCQPVIFYVTSYTLNVMPYKYGIPLAVLNRFTKTSYSIGRNIDE